MRHILLAIIVTLVLVIVQISIATPYPFALISFSAWIWWRGARAIAPWAIACSFILDLYSSVFGSTLLVWVIVLGGIAIISSTILTNRSFIALLAVCVGAFWAGSMLQWGVWYLFSIVLSFVQAPSIWRDINFIDFVIGLVGTLLYSIILWFLFTRGKRGRRVFLVSDQVL